MTNSFAKETLPISLEDEMRHSYLDYAMSVIVGRALPDVRDGLKPVHRRVLFAMHEANIQWNRPYKKCARIVGDVMGKYHPHGDSAIYDTWCAWRRTFRCATLDRRSGQLRIGRRRQCRAMRYTECRLDKIAPNCWPISTRKRSISAPTTTARRRSRWCCRAACPIC
jgi:DNA gyrase subunit A